MQVNKIRVAIFIYSLEFGGAERIVSYLLKEWEHRCEIHLILLKNKIDFPIPEGIIVRTIHSNHINIPFLKQGYIVYKLKGYLKDNGIEKILSFFPLNNIFTCSLKIFGWKGRAVISERMNTVSHVKSKFYFPSVVLGILSFFYKKADTVIAISNGVKNQLATLGVKNVVAIYNPIPISVRERHQKKVDQTVTFEFVSIARLVPVKNHKLIFDALSLCKDLEWHLTIVGDGPLRKELEKYVDEVGIKSQVDFVGFQKDTEFYLLNADCCVLSSNYEAFGNVILEAMQFSLPIIATDCESGPGEILDPTNSISNRQKFEVFKGQYGLLVKPGSVKAMEVAIRMIYHDQALRDLYSSKARQRVNDFDIRKIANQYYSLLVSDQYQL